jgi:hypothetical protein
VAKLTIGLGVILTLLGVVWYLFVNLKVARMLGGAQVERGRAAVVQAIVAALLAAFVIACVRSFVNARRNPAAGM